MQVKKSICIFVLRRHSNKVFPTRKRRQLLNSLRWTQEGPTLSPWSFSSKRRDKESGLIYYGRRFYIPQYGRWLTPDPSGFTDGMNLYAYVKNEPLTLFDEYGLWLKPRPSGSFSSSSATHDWSGIEQFSTGFNRGVMNAAFNTGRLANAAAHGLASPLHCFNWENKSFEFSMGNSYHSINRWFDRQQGLADKLLFSGGDPNYWGFRAGNFTGNFMGDLAIGKGLAGIATKGYAFGKNIYQRLGDLKNYVDPHKIRFSQSTISQNFSDGSTVNELILALKSKKVNLAEIPRIRVVEYEGKLITLDNRRLAAFQNSGVKSVPIERVSLTDSHILKHFERKMNPINGGNNVVVVPDSSYRAMAENILREYGKIE